MAKRVEIYRQLRDRGMSYEEIGDIFGVTRQAVHNAVSKYRDGFRVGTILKIKYIGLRNWMLENRITLTELERRCGVKKMSTLTGGRYDLSKKHIDAVLAVTGLTYEECFKEDIL